MAGPKEKKRIEMRKARRSGIGDVPSNMRILSPKEKTKKLNEMIAILKKRKEAREIRIAERKAEKAAKMDTSSIDDTDIDTDFLAAHAGRVPGGDVGGEASDGQIKKYGYMGGGKVYGQPRKANYTAG
jgi:hypothetical protein